MTQTAIPIQEAETVAIREELARMPHGRESALLRLLHHGGTAWVILLFALVLTAVAWHLSDRYIHQRARDRFHYQTEEIAHAISQRMIEYESVLRGGVGLFDSSTEVTRSEWRHYFSSLRIDHYYPGLQGVGFSRVVSADERSALEQQVRQEGFSEFRIWPEHPRDFYTTILYLEPFQGRNLRAFGYDMFTEAVRREAMERARDTGNAALSGIVTLVQETQTDVQRGLLLYLPLYRQGAPVETVEQRRAALLGFVYSPFRLKDLMRGILGARIRAIDFELFDGAQLARETLLYDSDGEESPHFLYRGEDGDFGRQATLSVAGRPWTIYFYSKEGFLSPMEESQPLIVACGGVLIDLLLFFIIASISRQERQAVALACRMTAELRQNHATLRILLDNFSFMVWLKDTEGRFLTVNSAYALACGATAPSVVGRREHDLWSSEEAQARDALSLQATRGKGPVTCELRVVRNGREAWFELCETPLTSPAGGVVGTTGYAREVTDRKALLDALQSYRERLDLATRAGNVGVWEWDPVTDLFLPDERILFLYHRSQEGLSDWRTWRDTLHPEDRTRVESGLQHLVRTGAPLECEFRIFWPDGTVRHLMAFAQAQRDPSGQALRVIGVQYDVTGQKRLEDELRHSMERAEEASRAKSTFLATMSHEIRTPLNTILGMNDMLLEGHLDKKQQGYAQMARRSGEVLLGLIDNILDFSRIEAGQVRILTVPFSLQEVVEDAVQILWPLAFGKGLALAREYDPDLPVWVSGDARRLRQILLNLGGNAIKFTEQGEVRIVVEQQGGKIHISVQDSGRGIAANEFETIFHPFTQGWETFRRQEGGTGLGLSICRQLAQAMGGDLGVSSSQGIGSTFRLSLPLPELAVPPPVQTLPTINRIKPEPSNLKRRLLLVDDAEDNCEVVLAYHADSRFEVIIAENGEKAVHFFREESYDLILMDMMMPVMDGVEATRRIRAWEWKNGLERTPIIMLTAHAVATELENSLAAGCDRYLTKPVRKKHLLETIDSCLAKNDLPLQREGKTMDQSHEEEPLPPVIDLEVLNELREEVGRAFPNVVNKFLEQLPRRIQELAQVRENGDCALAQQTCHRLKGIARTFGARRLEHRSEEMEKTCKSLSSQPVALERLTEKIILLQQDVAEVQTRMRALIQE